jgi:hypothetical protein
MTQSQERIAVFVFGVTFIATLVVLGIMFPTPTPWQYQLFRVVLALAAAGTAAMIPGSIDFTVPGWVKAGGPLAVFALLMYKSPAELVVIRDPMGPLEIGMNRQGSDFSLTPVLLSSPQECSSMCSANHDCKAMTYVMRPENFAGGDCWMKKEVPDLTPAANMVSAKKVL